uniref:Uncharacterized protein n=1 Tax=Melopsittacus undulatus TaxID=13146 RepID=A0A8V5HBM2_MELUD
MLTVWPWTSQGGGCQWRSVAFFLLGPTQGDWGCFPAEPCLQPMDEGSCQHYTLLWYYHAEANACRPFLFGGCQGNSNRFETKRRCEQQCRDSAGNAALSPPTLLLLQPAGNPSTVYPPPLDLGK